MFNTAISLTVEANGITVTCFGSVTPGSVKRRQDKPSYLYRLSDILVGNLSLSKQLLAPYPTLITTVSKSGSTNKLPAVSVLCHTLMPSEKPQNGATLVVRKNPLSALKG